ncbi:hypothetical protein VMCG_04030 [Cytospora schulzeri]|uniref:Carbohydrate-binding module family 19 domain-containing protein n=1 Tax=Cytospora schulzeri TaxID=448051 RepID=A0A423WTU5_9PEZI|nr:hypothetical protein VMCG_04030 [Valsa malicola]
MQIATTILAFAAAAMAAPYHCTFGQYVCSKDGLSISQCDISGQWVEIGPCPDGSRCSNIGDIPYCQAVTKKRDSPPFCSTPGTYACTGDHKGISVCNAQNQLVFNGACPENTHCGYLNGTPFCVDDAIKDY